MPNKTPPPDEIQTPLTAPPKISGARGGGDSGADNNAESVLFYPNGFTLELHFDYDRTVRLPVDPNTRAPAGYVPIFNPGHPNDKQVYAHKLSFVANSGVKFADKEAAILDVESMVEMAGRINEFRWNGTRGIDKDGVVRNMTNPNITLGGSPPVPGNNRAYFEAEHVTTLMSHVIYGGKPADMYIKDYEDAVAEVKRLNNGIVPVGKEWEVWWYTLKYNHDRHSKKMRVDVTLVCPNGDGGLYNVTIERWNSNDNEYEISCHAFNLSLGAISKVLLQTHWHSGVWFTYADLQPK